MRCALRWLTGDHGWRVWLRCVQRTHEYSGLQLNKRYCWRVRLHKWSFSSTHSGPNPCTDAGSDSCANHAHADFSANDGSDSSANHAHAFISANENSDSGTDVCANTGTICDSHTNSDVCSDVSTDTHPNTVTDRPAVNRAVHHNHRGAIGIW